MAEPTPARRARRHSGRRARQARLQRQLALLVAVVIATSLLALAVPRTMALVLIMPAERTLGQLQRQLPVESAEIDAAIDAGLAASRWIDSGVLWQQIARAHLARMEAASDQQARVDALLQAEATLQRALARRPGNAIAWWRLAWVAGVLERPAERVTAALHLSLVTGSRIDTLLFPRLRLALATWPHLDDAAREAFTPQLARAMRQNPRAFITLVRRSLAEEHVRAAFRGERDLLQAYQNLIDRSLPVLGARSS